MPNKCPKKDPKRCFQDVILDFSSIFFQVSPTFQPRSARGHNRSPFQIVLADLLCQDAKGAASLSFFWVSLWKFHIAMEKHMFTEFTGWWLTYPFWEMMEWKSVGMIIPFPTEWKVKKFHGSSHQPTSKSSRRVLVFMLNYQRLG